MNLRPSVLAALLLAGCARTATVELPAEGPGPALRAEVPASCTVETRRGPDFRVHHLACDEGRLGIYLGPHPGPHGGAGKATVNGSLAGREVTWATWIEDPEETPRHHREAVLDGFVTADGTALSLHVFAFAHDEDDVERLRRAAATLAVAR